MRRRRRIIEITKTITENDKQIRQLQSAAKSFLVLGNIKNRELAVSGGWPAVYQGYFHEEYPGAYAIHYKVTFQYFQELLLEMN